MEGIAQKEFLVENTKNPEISSIHDKIVKSFDSKKSNEMQQPSDFNPTSDLLFGVSAASYVKPTLETRNYNIDEAYAPLSDGTYTAKYESFKKGRDNNEYFAAQQTTGDKWINGITKAIAKTGSAVAGGTAGLVYGVGAALSDGSFSSIYDNSFSNTLADWDAKLSYQLPNFYSKQEQEEGLLGQMGTANFWSDKFLGGLSFTAGAIISEGIWAYATGGLSLSTMGARLGTKTAGKWALGALGETAALQGLSKYKGFYKSMMQNTLKGGEISKIAANNWGKAGEFISSVGVLARSAGYEASVEALQFKREATENFQQNFIAKNGREPSYEESQAFLKNVESSANAVFGVNMAILMPSNLVTMGHVLGIKSPIKTGFSSFVDRKAFGYGIEKVAETSGKTGYKVLEATTGQKVARKAFNYVVKPAVTEGLFEEGMQGVTTKTANKWLEHTYDSNRSNNNLDTMGAFYESLGEQYGTKEGWVENGLGILIGVVGGSVNARSEEAQRGRELAYEADVAETFKTSNLQSILMPNRLQSANRMTGFSEEAKTEAQKGNLVKSALAQKSALLTFINAKMVMGEKTSDIVKDIKFGLDATTQEQWAEVGIEEDQIESYKEESLKDFENLAKQWKTNKTYWGYMIGKKIVGEGSIDTPVVGSDSAAIVEALAWQSTIGETANIHMKEAQDILRRDLGSEYASAMKINSNLKLQKREFRQQLLVATRSFKTETARRDALIMRIAKLNAAPKQPEAANKPAGKQAAALTQALLETEQRLQELNIELEGYAEQVNKASAYESSLETVDVTSQNLATNSISGQDLVSLQDNIEKFGRAIEMLKETNPQRADYFSDLLKEYSDSEQVFLENQATQRAVLNPDFKIEQINSWVQGKVKKNTPMNENTKEWFERTLKSYEKTKIEAIHERDKVLEEEEKKARLETLKEELEALKGEDEEKAAAIQKEIDNLEKSEEKVVDKGEVVPKSEVVTQDSEPLTQVEIYKKRISEALKKNHNYLSYMGDNYDDIANKKPTSEEVEEFKKLRDENKLDEPRYKELQQKLSDWKLLDSAVDEQYVSIGDLIIGIEQLEQEVEEQETLTEVTTEDTPAITENKEIEESEDVVRYDILQNTNGAVTVKRKKGGNLTLHHLKLATIKEKLGGEFTLVNKDKKSILFGKEKAGSVLTINGLEFRVIAGNAIEVNAEAFMKLQEALNMYPINTGATPWSYSDVYTKVGEDFVKMDSNFEDNTINAERIYELKEGDKLTITINNDGYNDELLAEYKAAKGEAKDVALENLKNNLKLNVTTTDGIIENVSILKALRGLEAGKEQIFSSIREKAFEAYMAAEDKSNIKLGIDVVVDGIFLGSPRFILSEDGKTEGTPITERGAKEVIATGYIQDGEITLNREIKDVNKTFVGQLSKKHTGKKIPIVVFKRGNYNVAYPVSMKKTVNDLSSVFDSILGMNISDQEKVRKINQELQDRKIKTPKLAYEDIYNDKKLGDTREAFAGVETFVTADDFADKNYNIKNIVSDVLINIELKDIQGVLQDAKLRIKLDSSVRFKDKVEILQGEHFEVAKAVSDYVKELNSAITKAPPGIIEFSAGEKDINEFAKIIYEESSVARAGEVTPNVMSEFEMNIKVLKKALPYLNSLQNKVKKHLGKTEIETKATYLIGVYDRLKADIKASKADLKSGKDSASCAE